MFLLFIIETFQVENNFEKYLKDTHHKTSQSFNAIFISEDL